MNPKHRAIPTLNHVYIVAAFAMLMLRPLLTAVNPHDFWWHIRTGQLIWQQGAVPTVDSFSYTHSGEPFYNQGWLAQLLMYGLHQLGGVPLLLVVQTLVIALAYGLLLRLCIIRSGRLRLSVVLLLLTTLPLSFDNWTIRPQSYAFPIFAAFLTILTEWRLGRPVQLWLLVPLMALWANVHGSFVLGFALIGITWVGAVLGRGARGPGGRGGRGEAFAAQDLPHLQHPVPANASPVRSGAASAAPEPQASAPRPSRLVLWGALAAVAALLNPRGPALFGYVSSLLGTSAVTSLVTEWAPPTIRDLGGAIFFIFVILLVALLVYTPKRPDLTDLLLSGAFFWLALGAGRSIVWFGFVATPLLVTAAASYLRRPPLNSPGRPAPNGVLIAMLALLVAGALPWFKPALLPPPSGTLLAPETPVAAVAALRALPDRPKRLFHPMGAGSYLIWAAPEQPVFLDPRIELYPYAQWLDYISIGQGHDVAAISARYGFDGMLLDLKEQTKLAELLQSDPAWRLRYSDERFVMYTRR